MDVASEIDVITSDPGRLADLLPHFEAGSALRAYCLFRLLYLQGRIDDLRFEIARVRASSRSEDVKLKSILALGELRLRIRRAQPFQDLLPALDELMGDQTPWQGEAFVLLAMGYETLQDDHTACAFYQKAYESFHRQGLESKASNALHNKVAADSRMHPERRFIYDFDRAYRYALRAGELGTAGAALTNLSREYQKVGAIRAALRAVNRAISHLSEAHFGSYQYFQSICHRCHVLLELGRREDALADFEEASQSELPEIQFALGILRQYFELPKEAPSAQAGQLLVPTSPWQERQEELDAGLTTSASKPLSDTENRLVEYLTQAPRDKHELIEFLYADKTNYFDRENRLKQALHRLRKKRPGLIGQEGGRYFLNGDLFARTNASAGGRRQLNKGF